MADRMDGAQHSAINGLSIWVGLATFFSSSSERTRAHDILASVKAERKKEAGDGTSIRETNRTKGSRGPKRAVRKMSAALGLSKKRPVETESIRGSAEKI